MRSAKETAVWMSGFYKTREAATDAAIMNQGNHEPGSFGYRYWQTVRDEIKKEFVDD